MAPTTNTSYIRRNSNASVATPADEQKHSASANKETQLSVVLPVDVQRRFLENFESLRNNPYVRFNPSYSLSLSPEEVVQGIALLQAEVDRLPADPYAPSSAGRFRRYSRAIILPWEQPWKVYWIPGYVIDDGVEVAGYNQGQFNPEHHNERRFFPTVPEELRDLPLLNRLILTDVSLCDWSPDALRHPIIVGVHFVKTAPTPEFPVSVTTPNAFHQDGHMFSFVHLIRRQNAEGGMNAIAEPQYAGKQPEDVPPEHMHATFYLEQPLDSWGAYDYKVAQDLFARGILVLNLVTAVSSYWISSLCARGSAPSRNID